MRLRHGRARSRVCRAPRGLDSRARRQAMAAGTGAARAWRLAARQGLRLRARPAQVGSGTAASDAAAGDRGAEGRRFGQLEAWRGRWGTAEVHGECEVRPAQVCPDRGPLRVPQYAQDGLGRRGCPKAPYRAEGPWRRGAATCGMRRAGIPHRVLACCGPLARHRRELGDHGLFSFSKTRTTVAPERAPGVV